MKVQYSPRIEVAFQGSLVFRESDGLALEAYVEALNNRPHAGEDVTAARPWAYEVTSPGYATLMGTPWVEEEGSVEVVDPDTLRSMASLVRSAINFEAHDLAGSMVEILRVDVDVAVEV